MYIYTYIYTIYRHIYSTHIQVHIKIHVSTHAHTHVHLHIHVHTHTVCRSLDLSVYISPMCRIVMGLGQEASALWKWTLSHKICKGPQRASGPASQALLEFGKGETFRRPAFKSPGLFSKEQNSRQNFLGRKLWASLVTGAGSRALTCCRLEDRPFGSPNPSAYRKKYSLEQRLSNAFDCDHTKKLLPRSWFTHTRAHTSVYVKLKQEHSRAILTLAT